MTLKWAFWGTGQKNWILMGTDTVTVPATNKADAEVTWTPSITGHTCIMATVYHPWDENLNNNNGQENTHVHPVSSPGEFNFTLSNPTQSTALTYLEARQVDGQSLWKAKIERDHPQIQEPGQNRSATILVEAPSGTEVGQKRTFTVSAYIEGKLVGGIEFEVVVKTPTSLTCKVSPPEIRQGNSVTVSGAISPAVPSATMILVYTRPNGTTLTRTAATGSNGSYSDSYQPDAAGSWNVTTSWYGDSTHDEAFSSLETFNVKPPPPIPCPILLALVIAIAVIILYLIRNRSRIIKLLGIILIIIIAIVYYLVCIASLL